MKYVVHTDFTATYRWDGEAETEPEAGEKAHWEAA